MEGHAHSSERDGWGQHSWRHCNCYDFLTGTFWVLPLTYLYILKSARAYLFPQTVKIHYFCSGPMSVDPMCPQLNSVAPVESDANCGGQPFRKESVGDGRKAGRKQVFELSLKTCLTSTDGIVEGSSYRSQS